MKKLMGVIAILAVTLCYDVTSSVAQTDRTIPESVTHDCSKDVTAQVKSFVAGGNGKLQPNGCYKVNEKLTFSTKLDGNGSTIQQDRDKDHPRDPSDEPHTRQTGCGAHAGFIELKSNGQVSNIKLLRVGPGGYNECHYANHGIEIRGASNTVVQNVTMTNIWGDCIYFQGAQGSIIKNLDCVSNGRQGGAIAKGRDILIDGFKVRKSARSGFDFEANGTAVEDGIYNVEIRNFDFVSTNLIAFPSQGYNAPQDNIYIHDGVVRDSLSFVYARQTRPSSDGCRGIQTRHNWRVEDVTVVKVGAYGPGSAVFCGIENVTIKNVDMPTGYVVFESSRGQLLAQNVCSKEVRGLAQTVPIVQVGNTTPPCDTTVPPTTPTSKPPTTQPPGSTTTTRPPTSTAPPTSTTPPVVQVPCLIVKRNLDTVEGIITRGGACTPVG